MSSWQARVFARAIRATLRRRDWGDEAALARRARRVLGAPAVYGQLSALGLRRTTESSAGVHGEWLVPPTPCSGIVFYVHGGGFVSCSATTHRPIAAALARLTRRRVLSIDYRLAPEARLPAAHDDVAKAFEWLCRSGISSSHIAVVGDSAGGNLVLSLAIRRRDEGLSAPACVVAFSPWTDLAGRSPSVRTNDGRCAMFRSENIAAFAAVALGRDASADSPCVSPAYASLHDLPPVLLHVGSTELLLDDSRRVYDGIRERGGECQIHVYDDVPHCWQMLVPFVPEAGASLRDAASFISSCLETNRPGHS
jgi:epsilon-lactone hydrolase